MAPWRTPDRPTYRAAVQVIRFLTRAFAVATWRELGYLLAGGVTAAIAFGVVVAGTIVGTLCAILIIGLPVLIGVAYAFRAVADVERQRARILYDAPVERLYDEPRRGWIGRLRGLWSDPQTWRDFLWLILLSVIGFAFAVGAATLWGSVLYLLSLPLWWLAVPHSALPDLGNGWTVDTWSRVGFVFAGGVVGLVLTPWICAGLAHGEALLAKALLAPTRRSRLRARVDELTTTRAAAADVQADELRRIERDLHDGAQARLVAVAMELGRARDKLDTDPAAARALVDAAHEETKTALAELRELVSGMYPAILTDRGLDAALSSIAARCPVPVTLDVQLGERLPPAVEVAAYFVVAESLTNMAKHSGATSGSVRIRRSRGALEIDVLDDGVGGADASAGSGLAGLRDRVAALDGTLSLSSPRGGPTTLHVEMPCAL